ncbi:MAG: DUF2891 domain-containing protein [Taibaiella sp.]|nr:DUF2891 domain-containing protein [Taibaiella sp.]
MVFLLPGGDRGKWTNLWQKSWQGFPSDVSIRNIPIKTSHSAESEIDARLSPRELHPSFYGCFDWHSAVHGHWMLVRLLNLYPGLPQRDSIIRLLKASFDPQHIREEAAYFSKYKLGKIYERTYGWAWLLKLDQELYESQDPLFQQWHRQLQPLTEVIVSLWKEYLPKQTYPNRTGVHPNSAFALGFAMDWAQAVKRYCFCSNTGKKKRMISIWTMWQHLHTWNPTAQISSHPVSALQT